jgi:hypothetical protein
MGTEIGRLVEAMGAVLESGCKGCLQISCDQ